jgi:hypothetical protein
MPTAIRANNVNVYWISAKECLAGLKKYSNANTLIMETIMEGPGPK